MGDHAHSAVKLDELPVEVFTIVVQELLRAEDGLLHLAALSPVNRQLCAHVSTACSCREVWESRQGCLYDMLLSHTHHPFADHIQQHLLTARVSGNLPQLRHPVRGSPCFQNLLHLEVGDILPQLEPQCLPRLTSLHCSTIGPGDFLPTLQHIRLDNAHRPHLMSWGLYKFTDWRYIQPCAKQLISLHAGGVLNSFVISPANCTKLKTLVWTCVSDVATLALEQVMHNFQAADRGLVVDACFDGPTTIQPIPRLTFRKLDIQRPTRHASWLPHDVYELHVHLDQDLLKDFSSLFTGIRVLHVHAPFSFRGNTVIDLEHTAYPDLLRAILWFPSFAVINAHGWHISGGNRDAYPRYEFDRNDIAVPRLPARRNRFAGRFQF